MRKQMIDKILDEKVVAIVRGVYDLDCLNLAKALCAGGVKLMEVTFDQKSYEERIKTANTIQLLTKEMGDKMAFGAGTVTTVEMVEMAKEAGAQFIISPDTNESVIRRTVELDMVSIPGGFTPTEMAQAYNWGADFVKVFPANFMGPSYFKTVSAPLSQVRMLAVGGVDGANVKNYMAAGAVGVGVAGCLFKKDWIAAGDWSRITEATQTFMKTVQSSQ